MVTTRNRSGNPPPPPSRPPTIYGGGRRRFVATLGFNNLLEQDDKGDVSAETTGPAPAEVSAGIQISAERLLCYWLIPKSE
ncbi:hypothetical protein V6N11_047766 [Hibiscus sabdariffa]|uniref:Uncharacterized protein n=1 Tax=Hibiscus sabdariffa TaxID=183260 RepID=A0ABR2P7X6_9ROSI